MALKRLLTVLMISLMLALINACQTDDVVLEDELALKYERLIALSESQLCVDSSNWRFVGLGAKPCGGPIDYIPYAIQIDTVFFLDLITSYNEGSRKLNERNGAISDCMVLPPPIGIDCDNGKAVLRYEQN